MKLTLNKFKKLKEIMSSGIMQYIENSYYIYSGWREMEKAYFH